MTSLRRVADAIRRIVKDLRVSSGAAERATGLSGAQLFVLQQLATQPHLSINDLARLTFTHQSSVSVVVQRLVQKKMVARRRSRKDARQVELILTPKGRAMCVHAPEAAQKRLFAALATLGKSRQIQLAALLETVVHQMGLHTGPAELFFEEQKPRKRSRSNAQT